MSRFKSKKELRAVIDEVVVILDADATIGPRLKDLDAPIEIHFRDIDLTVNIRGGDTGERNLVHVWTKRPRWKPETRVEVTTDVANQFMQGKLPVARALALRKVRVKGSLTTGLKVVAICSPMFDHYRKRIETNYPHLVV